MLSLTAVLSARIGTDTLTSVKTTRESDHGKEIRRKGCSHHGGSTGMEMATAKRFVEEGMDRVFITGRRKDALDAAVADSRILIFG